MKSARILLGIFIVSVSIIPLIETGHSLLHSFKNPFHHHAILHQGSINNHSLADHYHFSKMKFAHEMYDDREPYTNFMLLAYGFFQPADIFQISFDFVMLKHCTVLTELLKPFVNCLRTRPPLRIR